MVSGGCSRKGDVRAAEGGVCVVGLGGVCCCANELFLERSVSSDVSDNVCEFVAYCVVSLVAVVSVFACKCVIKVWVVVVAACGCAVAAVAYGVVLCVWFCLV